MTSRRAACTWPSIALTAVAFIVTARPAPAQHIRWLTDYAAARKEATALGRPLFLDFGTENCMWCKRLDLTTFRDATVAGLLADKFVAMKVDAERDVSLAQSLRVTQYPTLVLASPDGKILGVLEGYQDATRLAEQLHKVTAAYSPPEWMLRDFQEAGKAVAESDYARAVTLLKGIIGDGKDRPLQGKARQVLNDLEQQAAGRLARAKGLHDRGQSGEAADALTELLKNYAGTQAASDGAALLSTLAARPEIRDQQRTRRARELLAQARDDFRTQQFLGCLERCDILTMTYADLAEGSEAHSLATQIKDDPDLMARVCDSLNQRTGAMYLALAEAWLKKGQPRRAQESLERAVQAAPGTRPAELARAKLAHLRGETTYQAEYNRAP